MTVVRPGQRARPRSHDDSGGNDLIQKGNIFLGIEINAFSD